MVRGLDEIYSRERSRIAAISDGAGDYMRPVFGEGPDKPFALLIGEAPGAEEAVAGRPFVGKAGKQLDRMLNTANIERDELFVTNAVKFRPIKKNSPRLANRTPGIGEINGALHCLREELLALSPRVVITMGNTPLRAICNLAGREFISVGNVHGRPMEVRIEGVKMALVPQYHPASVIYNPGLGADMEADLIALGKYLMERRGQYAGIK